jgi:hypothetical protein
MEEYPPVGSGGVGWGAALAYRPMRGRWQVCYFSAPHTNFSYNWDPGEGGSSEVRGIMGAYIG